MWTSKLICAIILVLSQANSIQGNFLRISSGFNAALNAPKCFVTVHSTFPESDVTRKCGGCLIAANKVLTTGNCVTTLLDGVVKNAQVTIGSGNPTSGTRGYGVSNITFAPGYNYTVRSSVNNLAVLTLNKTVKFTPRLAAAVPTYNSTQDAFVDQSLFVCGYGYINNKETKPNSLQCTYLTGVPGSVCDPTITTLAPGATTTTSATTSATTAAPTSNGPIICTENLDDSNACHGDQGSPVFIDNNGQWDFIGIVSNFVNVRQNAPCLDGHNTIILQLGGFSSWIPKA